VESVGGAGSSLLEKNFSRPRRCKIMKRLSLLALLFVFSLLSCYREKINLQGSWDVCVENDKIGTIGDVNFGPKDCLTLILKPNGRAEIEIPGDITWPISWSFDGKKLKFQQSLMKVTILKLLNKQNNCLLFIDRDDVLYKFCKKSSQ